MSRLRLRLLGSFELSLDNRPISDLYSDKARALLAFLALGAQQPHPRGELAALLWPESDSKRAQQNCRQALSKLQRAIGNRDADPPYLTITRRTVQFNRASDYWLDVEAVRDGAVDAYRGPLLAHLSVADSTLFEEWATIQREALHREVLLQLQALARQSADNDNLDGAVRYAARQVQLDPWREEAYRDWIRFLLAGGNSAEARRVFEQCRRTLHDDLGIEPSAETVAVLSQPLPATRERAPEANATPTLVPHNLPRAKAPLIGRTQELAAIADLLADPDCHWLTLVGLGGSGKTRLALSAAHACTTGRDPAFRDGVWFVSLVGATDLLKIAHDLHFPFQSSAPPRDQLVAFLRDKQLLLLLDNCEQLLGERDWLTELLAAAPGVQLLTTSRQSFDAAPEWVYDVGGLSIAGTDDDSEAAQLFAQAARRAAARFRVRDVDRPHINHICSRVQGHPLSIELAASWVRLLSVAQISAEIDRDFDIFETKLRHLPPRQRSLRLVFDHTWQTLTRHEQQIMTRLAVFRGGFTRAAATKIAGASLIDLLQLVNKALVQRRDDRFVLHEAVAQYAATRLSTDERAALRQQHADVFAAQLVEWGTRLRTVEQAVTMAEISADFENVKQAFTYIVQQDRTAELHRLTPVLIDFLRDSAQFHTGHQLFASALSSNDRWIRLATVIFCIDLDRYDEGAELLPGCLHAMQHADDQPGIAMAYWQQGRIDFVQDRYDAARAALRTAQDVYRHSGAELDAALMGYRLGEVDQREGDIRAMLAHYQGVLPTIEAFHYPRALAAVHHGIGVALGQLGQAEAAMVQLRRGIAIGERLGASDAVLKSRNSLALLYMHHGREDEADRLLHENMVTAQRLGLRSDVGIGLNNLGLLSQIRDDLPAALSYYQQAYALFVTLEQAGYAAVVAGNVAEVATELGEFDSAELYLQRCLTLSRQANNLRGLAAANWRLAVHHAQRDNRTRSAAHLREGLHLLRQSDSVYYRNNLLAAFGHYLRHFGRPQRAWGVFHWLGAQEDTSEASRAQYAQEQEQIPLSAEQQRTATTWAARQTSSALLAYLEEEVGE